MTEARRYDLCALVIALSLLFHASIFVLFLMVVPPDRLMPDLSISFEDQPQQPNTQSPIAQFMQPAALKPRASQFGTPNDFQDAQPAPQPQSPDQQEQQESKNETEADDQKEKEEDSHVPKDQLKMAQSAQPDQTDLQSMQEEVQPNPPAPRKRRRRRKRPLNKQLSMASAPVDRQDVTFADIARGFIESLKNEGNDWLKRDGDDKRRPDPVEMRYISYVQKIVWYLQNSFRQTLPKEWPDTSVSMSFKITLNKEGEIHHIELVQPSGNSSIDQFTQKRIQKAGPFPPLPDHFKDRNFQIILSCTVGNKFAPQIYGQIACVQP